MVNNELFDLLGEDPHSQIHLKLITHQKFFNIMLVDFLSCSDTKILGEEKPYLRVLASICDNPNFNQNNSIKNLNKSTQNFRDWLNQEVIVEDLWLPSINLKSNLSIKRIEFIKICGNISKHNFTRLSSVANDIISIFQKNQKSLTSVEALSILDEFYEWFHDNIFNYHSSAIAEFLNNILWGIYEYLLPEYNQSIIYVESDNLQRYEYAYPQNVNNEFAKKCYWELMNKIRHKPYMKKFEVTEFLKMRY